MSARPPRSAAWLLERLLDAASREAVAGDLEEEYRDVRHRRGRFVASLWYWRAAALSLIACRITGQHRPDERRLDFAAGARVSLRDLVRPAFRQFRDQPLYALGCAGTLALAVGAACASFAVVKRALLDPLPYADGDTIVSVLTMSDGSTSAVSAHVLEDLRASAPPLTGFAPIRPSGAAYSDAGGTVNGVANLVTADYFTLLGVRPAAGRIWTGDERDAVVVSSGFWTRVLASDPTAIGRAITIDGRMRTIVGILPPEFVTPYWSNADFWLPLDMTPLLTDVRARRQLTVLARRPNGASQHDVDAHLSWFSTALQQKHPDLHARQAWVAVPLRAELVGPARPALIGTAAAAVLLLLIVGTNVAGLSTAHAVAARHQLAIRAALGATRTRLFVEQLVDSLVLAVVGTIGGIWIADVLVRIAARYQRQFLDRLAPISLDATTVAAGVVAGLAVGVVAALLPRGVLSASQPVDALRGARGSAGHVTVSAARTGLVVAQVGLALVLLIGAGLLVRTVRHLSELSLGFRSDGLTTLSLNLPGAKYQSQAAQVQFERDVVERLAQMRGIRSVSASVGFPIVGGMGAGLVIKGRPRENGLHEIAYFSVSPEFMSSIDARLIAGRDVASTDDARAPRVVLINESMARTFWPDGGALGAQVQIGTGSPNQPWITVVGVVADIRQHGPTEAVRPTAFGSTFQYSWPRRYFTVRTEDARPVSLATDLRAAIRAVDPAVAVGAVTPVEEMVSDRTARHTLVMVALTVFGVVALVLCLSGLYAVVVLTSRMRRREYAIRMALGAQRGDVRWMVVRQALALAAAGAGAGLMGSALGTRFLQGLLHGVAPLDGPTFAGAAAGLLFLAALAAWYPARQAGRVDPVETLKAE